MSDETAIAKQTDIHDLMRLAVEKGADGVAALEKLVALKERVDDRNASHEFSAALAKFQQECPAIEKTSTVDFTGRSSGVRVRYTFASLEKIVEVVRPILTKNDLSFNWDSEETDKGIKVVCKLYHSNGHMRPATFSCPAESKAGMSRQQGQAAALTFARRQSLVQVLGLTTTEPDTDAVPTTTITDQQAADLRALMDEVKANERRFLKVYGVESVDDLPAGMLHPAINALQAKRRAG